MKSLPVDHPIKEEYQRLNPDGKFAFDERIAISFEDKPLVECHEDGIESAMEYARSVELKLKRQKQNTK